MLYVNPIEAGRTAPFERLADKSLQQKAAAQELEHYFLFMLLQSMRKTAAIIEESDKSSEKQFYYELLDDALSGEMAKSGQLGIARQIEAQLSAVQGFSVRCR